MSLRRAEALAKHTLTFAVPKNRRPKFELHLKIIDLNNVPLVSGTSFIKWHLPHSTSAEHRGRTPKHPIKDHKVDYSYSAVIPVRLTIDKNGMLQESYIHFEVVQEYGNGGRGERVTLGYVKLNLSEYVEASEIDDRKTDVTDPDEKGVTRRYLMQESKINSTLKISIYMRQVDGDRNFIAPPLRTAQVFSGIAGVISTEQAETGDVDDVAGAANSSLTRSSREAGELADMYRRTLAASWFSQPGELAADQCIEDIFAGGDGWGDKHLPHDSSSTSLSNMNTPAGSRDDSGSPSEDEKGDIHLLSRRMRRRHLRGSSGDSNHFLTPHNQGKQRSKWRSRETLKKQPPRFTTSPDPQSMSDSASSAGTATPHLIPRSHSHLPDASVAGPVRGRASLEQQANAMKAEVEKSRRKPACEVDELDIREDLRSWRLPVA